MRVKSFSRVLRIVSAIVLFFFVWTFGQAWQLAAWAATNSQSPAKSPTRKSQDPEQRSPEERFEKALEEIREKVGKAEEKAGHGDAATEEIEAIRIKRAEIESLDAELRKEFEATEKKLKDAKLPTEILERHYKFVKNYEDNFNELKANLIGHENAQKAHNKVQEKEYLRKIKDQLERTKPTKKHVPLDPNKLPFQNRKAKGAKAPRLKKEEFEKDFPRQKRQTIKTAFATDGHGWKRIDIKEFLSRELAKIRAKDELSTGRIPWNRAHTHNRRAQEDAQKKQAFGHESTRIFTNGFDKKPVLVATTGPLAGLLSGTKHSPQAWSFSEPSVSPVANGYNPQPAIGFPQWGTQNSELNTQNYLLAQAADLPTTDDLAETPDVTFSSEIRAKAQELGGNPVKIYEYVRNNIEFVPTYGSIQGADMCLQTKQCNAFDTASLLVALLRVSGIASRYMYGTAEISIDRIINWVGEFSDPVSALNFMASGGIPVTGLRSGGKIYAARMEHVWIKAFIDYIPSMGGVHKQGDTWIPLDASFKQYNYSGGVDLSSAVPFDGQALADQIKATATINEQEGYVTNVSSTIIEAAQKDYNAQLENYVNQNIPNATPGDILGKKEIIKKEQPILPASLPYKVVVAGAEAAEIPDSLRRKVAIQLVDADSLDTVFTHTISLPELAGKRFTVSYDPATTADQDTIIKYIEEYATNIPAYLIQFKPVLKLENVTVATGPTIGMGSVQNLTVSLTSPRGTENVTHNITAGDYTAIGINPSTINLDVLQNRTNKNDFGEPVGEMLHQTALSYWAETDAVNNIIAKTLRVNNLRHPSELAASAKVSVSYIWGVPSSATYNRRNIDVKLDNQSLVSKTSDKTKEFYYMQQSGVNSSFLEGAILDQLFGGNIGDSISAVTALNVANGQGIPIYRIDSSNVATMLSKVQASDAVKTDVSNAVNAGLTVQIPQINITQSGWTGIGYIALNATDGTGAYRISGGLDGGDSNSGSNTVIPLPRVPLTGAAAFVVGGISSNVGVISTTDTGVLIGIKIAPELVAAGAMLALMGIMLLIWGAIKAIADKYQPEPRWETYRHFTSMRSIIAIITPPQMLKVGAFEGEHGYGVYLTKRFDLQPDSYINAFGVIGYGPNCYLILKTLVLPSIDRTEGYIDFSIDMNRRGVIPKAPPNEYLLMGMPGEIMLLGSDIRVLDYWYPGIQP